MVKKGWYEIVDEEIPKLRLAIRALSCHSKYHEKRGARSKIRKFHEGIARIAASLVPIPKGKKK